MKTIRQNLTEWFSTSLGALVLIAVCYNAFTNYPQAIHWLVSVGLCTLAGVLMFGNPKEFFNSLGSAVIDKLNSKKLE